MRTLKLNRNTQTSYNYYVYDNQGSVRAVLNASGELTQATDYSAYGVPSSRYAGTSTNNHLHLGLEWQPMKGVSGYYNNARFRDALLAGTFYQQDPLAEKYHSFSPYHYGANNPNRYLDINGMDIWHIDTNGYARKISDDKEIDEIQMVDSNGEKILDANGIPLAITFKYGTIESHTVQKWGDNEQSDYWQVRGDDNARALFEFFSENISANKSVEFSLTQVGVAGDNGLNFVSTSHERGKERSFFQLYIDKLQYGYTYRGHIHSHPASSKPGTDDKHINSVISKAQIANGLFKPSFSIYYVNKNDKDGKYNYYVPY